ncbi:porin [Azohydromonas caseinilytica]|uniref:Porin n=1 Tax=Azohydromonas caseinilytica TaxID=2728836 RepID=A0A848F5C8_9BURK|nr:porin [Azohydromonas caseinilytica]NML14328.1 porin [Azohydromonas caseinilytica]
MKKLAFLLAALPAAAAVHAQSNVTLYGRVDMAVEHTNHANANGDSITRATSGAMNTSRWGLQGSEDLGNGLKAVFQLEGGLLADTGAMEDGTLFGRQATVGLQGSFGRIVAGRSFTTVYDFMLPFDPMGYSANYSWATNTDASSPAQYGLRSRNSNLLKYQGSFGPVTLGASYGFGETTGSTAAGAFYALAAAYAAGPFSAAVTAERLNGGQTASPRDETTVYHVGAAYELSKALTFKAAYRNYRKDFANPATRDPRADVWWGGATYQITPAWSLTGAVYHVNVKTGVTASEADRTLYVLRAKYALSKRTDLYAATGHARAKDNQSVGLLRDNAGTQASPGVGITGFSDTQTGVTVGIQHRF